jgi:hypothetical protein
MAEQFWVSTGDIKHPYETINIVSSVAFVPTPAFGSVDFSGAFRNALDLLARQAQAIGANGVIWVHYFPAAPDIRGFSVFAWGTAVRVTSVG